jgi:hypothetical protein
MSKQGDKGKNKDNSKQAQERTTAEWVTFGVSMLIRPVPGGRRVPPGDGRLQQRPKSGGTEPGGGVSHSVRLGMLHARSWWGRYLCVNL